MLYGSVYLNLVINDAVRGVSEAVQYFTILQDVYCSFSDKILTDGESTVTLNELRPNPTCWAGRLLTVLGMKHNCITVLKLLTTINLVLQFNIILIFANLIFTYIGLYLPM